MMRKPLLALSLVLLAGTASLPTSSWAMSKEEVSGSSATAPHGLPQKRDGGQPETAGQPIGSSSAQAKSKDQTAQVPEFCLKLAGYPTPMPGWHMGWLEAPSKKYSQSEPLESIQALKLLSDPTQDQLQYLGQMPNLTTIDMSDGNLGGLDFSCLTKVQELNLRATGGRTTPDLSSLVRLPHLRTLKLSVLREGQCDNEKDKANALALAGLSHVTIIRANILGEMLFTADDVIQQARTDPEAAQHIGSLDSPEGREKIKWLISEYNRGEIGNRLHPRCDLLLQAVNKTDPNCPYNKSRVASAAFAHRDFQLSPPPTALTVPTPTPVASLYDLTKGIAPQKVGVILQGISQNGAADVRIQADFARARLKYEDPKTYSALTDDETYALFTHISQNAAAQPDLRAQADFYRAIMNLEARVNTLNPQEIDTLLLRVSESPDAPLELRIQADFYRATMNLEGRVNTLNPEKTYTLLLGVSESPHAPLELRTQANFHRAAMNLEARVNTLTPQETYALLLETSESPNVPLKLRTQADLYRAIMNLQNHVKILKPGETYKLLLGVSKNHDAPLELRTQADFYRAYMNLKGHTNILKHQEIDTLLLRVSESHNAPLELRTQADFYRADINLKCRVNTLEPGEIYTLLLGVSESPHAPLELRAQADFYRADMNLDSRVKILTLEDVCYLLEKVIKNPNTSPKLRTEAEGAFAKAMKKLTKTRTPKPSLSSALSGGTGRAPNPPEGDSSSAKAPPGQKDGKEPKKKS